MAKRLLLLRHARIVADHVGRLIGATDVPLDPSGEAQAQALADRVLRWGPQACYCSPMQRCRQTAAAVAPDLPLLVDPDLREIDFGQWENRTFAEAAAKDPSLVDRWAAFDLDFAFPAGKAWATFLRRVQAAADRLVSAEPQTVLVVTHGGVIRTMICHLLGLEPRKYVAFDVPYAAMAVIDMFDGQGVLAALERPELWRTVMAEIVLVTGGCRSGKSAYAQQHGRVAAAHAAVRGHLSGHRRRNAAPHRGAPSARRGRGWDTVEEQLDLAGVFAPPRRAQRAAGRLRDALGQQPDVSRRTRAAARRPKPTWPSSATGCSKRPRRCRGTVIFVTNEVGMGVVPENAPARRYRDLVGRANQIIAARADAVTLMSCGIPCL